jgi:predicted RNase H-like HicB family nuclease
MISIVEPTAGVTRDRISTIIEKNPKGKNMNSVYTAVTKQDDSWWIGWIEEVPGVNCQERTHEELLESLKITLKEALEFNRKDAISAPGTNFREEQIAI